mgnify:CR=1 FL=1
MEFKYLAEIQGGTGPEVWDKEIDISASSFMDAAVQAYSKAQELGGFVTSLFQADDDAAQAPRSQHDTRQEPVFWYRPRSDGGFEGPIHNSALEDVRKASGAWVGLYVDHSPID